MTDALLSQLAARLRPVDRPWSAQARSEQLPPDGRWSTWLICGGRGGGKTRAGAEWVLEQANRHAETSWAVIAPTFGAARDVCAEGPSGLLACALQDEVDHYVRSLGEIRLTNGSRIYLRSADEPDRLRGFNLAGAWCDEIGSWRYASRLWHEALMPAVRIAPARIVATTTPRPTSLMKDLLGRSDGSVAITRVTTFDNAENLSETALDELRQRYEGTRLGRAELGGELLEDVEGALWTVAMLDDARLTEEERPELDRVVVGVDPSGTAGGDECGIVVAGIFGQGAEANFFVLEDASFQASPDRWARRVADVYARQGADRVIVEGNFGADMATSVLRNVDPNIPLRRVTASRGKVARAEPVAALSEQRRLHHVGVHVGLETELTTWVPGVGKSPGRLDAMVWAVTDLMESLPRRGARMTMGPRRRPPPALIA